MPPGYGFDHKVDNTSVNFGQATSATAGLVRQRRTAAAAWPQARARTTSGAARSVRACSTAGVVPAPAANWANAAISASWAAAPSAAIAWLQRSISSSVSGLMGQTLRTDGVQH